MVKLLLVLIIVASVVIPLRAASDGDARRGLRRTVWAMVGFNVLYLLGLLLFQPPLK